MELEVTKDDPLGILASTLPIVKNADFVFIHEDKLQGISDKIIERYGTGLNDYELGVTNSKNIEQDLQLVFIEDVVNFSFWPTNGQKKWEVEWPVGAPAVGGWYGLVACFKRGLAEGVPILNAKYLSTISDSEAHYFFRGSNDTFIPLLEERVKNLREAGSVLLQKFNGNIRALIELSNYDAIEIVKNITENFPSFRDISNIKGNEIKFLKRAQICPNDFSYLLKDKITNLDKLTAYADYKLPQILRMFGVISYKDSLSKMIDDVIEIPHESREEIEIRAATIWAVELLRQKIGKLTAGEIDNTLWVMSQDIQNEAKPYHRSRTIYY